MMRTLLLAALVTAAPAYAYADAAGAWRDGRWAETISAGRAENTAASLVLSGRATLTVAGYQATDKAAAKTAIAAAERDFDAAIAKAPGNLEARVQKAIAVGYRAKLDKSPGEGKAARALMEGVTARDAGYPLANAALGGWHGGAVATLGPFLASTLLGANRKDMERYFGVAMAREPRAIIHPVTFAVTLLDIDADNAKRAGTLLKSAAAMPVRDAFDAQNRKAAMQILALIDRGDAKGARTLAKRLQPFGALA